ASRRDDVGQPRGLNRIDDRRGQLRLRRIGLRQVRGYDPRNERNRDRTRGNSRSATHGHQPTRNIHGGVHRRAQVDGAVADILRRQGQRRGFRQGRDNRIVQGVLSGRRGERNGDIPCRDLRVAVELERDVCAGGLVADTELLPVDDRRDGRQLQRVTRL